MNKGITKKRREGGLARNRHTGKPNHEEEKDLCPGSFAGDEKREAEGNTSL